MKSKSVNPSVWLWMVLIIVGLSSCKKDDDKPGNTPEENETELITNVELTFTNTADSTDITTATFSDPDGEGGEDPVITPINLNSNTVYTLQINLTDASNPADPEDITEEVEEENLDHQFFFELLNGAANQVSITYGDYDSEGMPLGLQTIWSVGSESSSSTESVRITLIHQPDKNAPDGIAINNPSAAGGETDVQIVFDLNID